MHGLDSAGLVFGRFWAPANKESSHVGHAGVGLVNLKGAPLSLPTFASSAFASCFAQCRALRSHVSIGGSRILHLVVACGFQGAASDPEKLSLADSVIDAVLGELAVAAAGQPCLIVGDLNVEPTWTPCLLKGVSAGSWFFLQASWAHASGTLLVLHASILFIQLLGPGVILPSAAPWQLLPWVGVGLLVIVGLCRAMLSELLFIFGLLVCKI